MSTCIFSYNEANKHLTLNDVKLVQTFPLSRVTAITKNSFTIGKDKFNDVVLFDDYVSAQHCKIEMRGSKFLIKDLQSTNGTTVNNQKVIEAFLPNNASIGIGKAQFVFQWTQENIAVEPVDNEQSFHGMVSDHPAMKEIFGLIQSLAPTSSPVLIQGETGTGKELIARALHNTSARKSGNFVSINCGAIARELIESELFGHEKGAFTGAAVQRIGLFELANGGTIFLDEIGELPLELQPKLLRVLESGELRRVGGNKNITVDVRIVTATHRDLQHEIVRKRFREDLYYRIHVLPITLPPLRNRKSDIVKLVEFFLQNQKTLNPAALAKLQAHDWPGNIRELKNVIERSKILAFESSVISEQHIYFASSKNHTPHAKPVTLEEIEKMAIIEAMQKNNGIKTATAEKLGIAKSTLHEKLRKYGIGKSAD